MRAHRREEYLTRYTPIPQTWNEALACYTARRDHSVGERKLEHETRLVNPHFPEGKDVPVRLDLYHQGNRFARFHPTNDITVYPGPRGEILRRRLNTVLARRGEIDSSWLYRPAGAGYEPTFLRNMTVINTHGHTLRPS